MMGWWRGGGSKSNRKQLICMNFIEWMFLCYPNCYPFDCGAKTVLNRGLSSAANAFLAAKASKRYPPGPEVVSRTHHQPANLPVTYRAAPLQSRMRGSSTMNSAISRAPQGALPNEYISSGPSLGSADTFTTGHPLGAGSGEDDCVDAGHDGGGSCVLMSEIVGIGFPPRIGCCASGDLRISPSNWC